MDPQTNRPQPPRIPNYILYLVLLFVVGACGYLLVTAFKDYQGSGELVAVSPDAQTLLSVSQANHQAKFIGIGSTKVRLQPGNYEVASSYKGGQALVVAEVKKGQTSQITLPPNKDSLLPSIYSISFNNLDSLTSQGISSTQIAELKEYLFKFKKTANKIIVDSNSVQPGPHNPDTDVGFSTVMNLTIDSASYRAKITYIGLDDLRLILNDSAGHQVFDSGV